MSPNSAASKRRFVPGLLLVLLALGACLPVPIGDPERSRVIDAYNGTWISASSDDCIYVLNMRPYDRRTWIVAWYCLDLAGEGNDVAGSDAGYAEIIAALATSDVAKLEAGIFKGWEVTLAKQQFLTWEPMTFAEPMRDEAWYVWKADLDANGDLLLNMVNAGYAGFEELEEDEKTRKRYESVIKKNVDAEGLYDDPQLHYFKVREKDERTVELMITGATLATW